MNSSHSLVVLQMISALFNIYMAMATEPFDAKVVSSETRKFLVLYESLSKETIRKHEPLMWRMKPKFHLV